MGKGPLLPARGIRGRRVRRSSAQSRQTRPAASGREDQPVLLRNKLRVLEEIVPGSRDLDAEALLRRTADYIALLELRVSVLRGLSNLYGV
ncbi:hypothetical protein Taro_041320 [Colocasia esculenta]|uniref:BHLH domain-containing protein n=1 Tax=Colocasia esculenta TaxID=4460 RepID=A0A843WL68_COLES|nr:hypothetical protein [Colocasia esculenta]